MGFAEQEKWAYALEIRGFQVNQLSVVTGYKEAKTGS